MIKQIGYNMYFKHYYTSTIINYFTENLFLATYDKM